ncbi:MAG: HAMP domain-containing sensor histidine kinase [Ruminococcus sp.]|nr:HAMP domain-containing sensor histidine kinase [Ruminococcus sp.]
MTSDKLRRLLHIALTAAGAAICAFFSIPAAIVLVAVSAAIFAVDELMRFQRRRKLFALCNDIDRILKGSDSVTFADYNEGALSILTAEIHKMTIMLREQNSALSSDKLFMKESMEDIAHQLRTPLTSMMLLMEMLRDPDLAPQQRAGYVQELYSLLSRMNWLIDTMLGLSRIDAGAVKFREQEIRCRELISSALEPISISLELKNISVDVSVSGEPAFIGDMQYFTEALLNILKNCMEHTPEGGTITISAAETPIYTGITVTDSGSGFSGDDLDHIFERFYRSGEPSKSGYGIGLAFARRIVTSQSGSLQAYNAPNGGACFDMRIYNTAV